MRVLFYRDDLLLLVNLTIFPTWTGFDPDMTVPGFRASSPSEPPINAPNGSPHDDVDPAPKPEPHSPDRETALLPYTPTPIPLSGPYPVRPQSGGMCKVDDAGQGTCVPWTSRCGVGGIAFANKCPNNEYCCVFAHASILNSPSMLLVLLLTLLLLF